MGKDILDKQTLELSEACDRLGELMKNDPILRTRDGGPIQFFHEHLVSGETPAMALALVKKFYYDLDELPSHDGTLCHLSS